METLVDRQHRRSREARVRREAIKRDLVVQKSRSRNPDAIEYGGYRVIDPSYNGVVFGWECNGFGASLEDIEEYFAES